MGVLDAPVNTDGRWAYAENVSNVGAAHGISPGATVAYGCVICVLPSPKPLTLRWSAHEGVTTGGQGAVLVGPVEFNIATPAFVDGHFKHCLSSQPVTAYLATPKGHLPIGIVTAPRWFYLGGQVIREGSSLSTYMKNLATDFGKSWLGAFFS